MGYGRRRRVPPFVFAGFGPVRRRLEGAGRTSFDDFFAPRFVPGLRFNFAGLVLAEAAARFAARAFFAVASRRVSAAFFAAALRFSRKASVSAATRAASAARSRARRAASRSRVSSATVDT